MIRKAVFKIVSVFAAALAFVLPTALVGCSEESAPVTPAPISFFVNYVTRIATPITIDSEADIEAGYIIYEHLSDKYKNNGNVKDSKNKLDKYKTEYDVIRVAQDKVEAEKLQASYRNKFVKAVQRLPEESNITLKDAASVDAAFALYENLDETSRGDGSVVAAYVLLNKARGVIKQLEEEERIEKLKEQAKAFVDGVDALVEEEITLDSENAIEDLLYDYGKLAEEAQAYENVVAAKQKLDAAAAEFRVLKDEADVENFLARISKLPGADGITLDNKNDIERAEKLYKDMSETAKTAAGVAEAYEKLQKAREKYDVLFAAAEKIKINEFIEAANKVPTDIKNIDITWFDVLDNASAKYEALSYASKNLPEIEEAFNRWDAAQTAFDKLGFERVPLTHPGVVFSGDAPPHIVLQLHAQMLDPLYKFFNKQTLAGLDEVAVLQLNVYVGGSFAGRADIKFADLIDGGHILPNNAILGALRTASATNDKIVSGAMFSFTLSVRDKAGKYISSKETARTLESGAYSW